MESKPSVKRRTYDSTRRTAQAAQTRAATVRAARDLFVEQGFARTTLAEIAQRAGVSVETVSKSVGTKADLLHRAWDITIGGDERDVMFHERDEIQAIRREPDLRRRLRAHARFYTATAQRIAPFLVMLQAAGGTDRRAAALLEEIDRQRRVGMATMAAEAAATGRLTVTEDECRDMVWAMSDGVLWHRLVVESGWSNERFAEWLGQVWVAALVGPERPSG